MNLIICCTPFQVLLAEKIIAMHPEKKFYGIMIASIKNEKYNLYTKRLLDKCEDGSIFFEMSSQNKLINRLLFIINCLIIKRICTKKKFDTVYFANIDSSYIHSILSSINFNTINTFDDGTINIIPHNFFFKKKYKKNHIKKFIFFLLHKNITTKFIINNSALHYTIYKDQPNIINNTIHISLSNKEDNKKKIQNNNKEDEISVLLGQPIYELLSLSRKEKINKNIYLVKKTIQEFNIDLYFPHPRENFKIDNIQYIHTDLIAEDYFAQLNNKKIKLYTFFSGAALSLLTMDHINVISVMPTNIEGIENIETSYNLFHSFGIDIKRITI